MCASGDVLERVCTGGDNIGECVYCMVEMYWRGCELVEIQRVWTICTLSSAGSL